MAKMSTYKIDLRAVLLCFLMLLGISGAASASDCVGDFISDCSLLDGDALGCEGNYTGGGPLYQCVYNLSELLCFASNSSCDAPTTSTTSTTSTTAGATTTTLAAVLSNVSLPATVYINDIITARVQLTNTGGSYLEAQDCSVVSYHNGSLLYDYNTRCQYAPELLCGLDDSQPNLCNWAAASNCSFTDSMGNYYFMGRTDEGLGYRWNETYELVITCNMKNSSASFTLANQRGPVDTDRIEDFLRNNGGYVVLLLAGGLSALFGIALVLSVIGWSWKRGQRAKASH